MNALKLLAIAGIASACFFGTQGCQKPAEEAVPAPTETPAAAATEAPAAPAAAATEAPAAPAAAPTEAPAAPAAPAATPAP